MTVGRTARVGFSLLLGALAVSGPPTATRAAVPYQLASNVDYRIDPAARLATVSAALTFTNTQPNPPNGESVFNAIEFAVQSGASEPAATDATGVLTATIAVRNGVTVASIKLRAALKSGQAIDVRFSYHLADGADPAVRVRPALITLPVWGFGTSSEVSVLMPADYLVRTTGDTLTPTQTGDILTLTSGPITDPLHWLVELGATRDITFAVTTTTVPLAGATIELRIRSWPDDAAWGERIRNLAVAALPAIEGAAGLRYPGGSSLVITESPTTGDPTVSVDEVAIAFDASDFVVVHQLAHQWYGPTLFADRWLQEGFASHAAALVAPALTVSVPYAPANEAERLMAGAFPLAEWTATSTGADGWAYAASWDTVDRIGLSLGADRLQAIVAASATGASGYDPVSATSAGSRPGVAVDSRHFIDLVEPLGTTVFPDAELVRILGPDSETELAARTTAREHALALADAAGELGLPDPVVIPLTAWDFPSAESAMTDAVAWLDARDSLVAAITRAGLTVPDRLSAGFQDNGGSPAGMAEIAAESAVVDAYQEAATAVAEPRSFLEEVGLLGMEDPGVTLDRAAGAFAAGDLRTAADLSAQVSDTLDRAWWAGLLRVAAVSVAIGALLAVGILALRRRYTRHE